MNKHFGFSLFVVAAGFMLLGAGCNYYSAPTDKSTPVKTESATDTADQISVKIENYAFQPNNLTVKSGTTVTWTNNDSAPHTVTALDGSFGSGTMYKGDTFTYTFTKPGSASYLCAFHKSMLGSVIVTE